MNYDTAHSLLSRLQIEENDWAIRHAPSGDTYTLDDGASLHLSHDYQNYVNMVESDPDNREWASLLLGDDSLHVELREGGIKTVKDELKTACVEPEKK